VGAVRPLVTVALAALLMALLAVELDMTFGNLLVSWITALALGAPVLAALASARSV
jgi:hypothetical protein